MDSQPDSDIQIAGYRIEARVGRGGMGEVYRAVQLNLGRRVALKVLARELADDDVFRRRFLRESRIAASIDHPSIIPIYETGEDDGLLYIAMRYVDGLDLATLLEREGHLEPTRAMAIMAQVASALDAAHARGLVHRDVKPANILLAAGPAGTQDHCYLCDFGLIKQVGAEQALSALTATDQFVGTIPYVAPEQIEGRDLDGRTDVYSLGCVLFHCLTGSVPFAGTNDVEVVFAHLREPPPPLSARAPGLPPAMDPVVARAMAKTKEDRWPTCSALVAALTAQVRAGARRPAPSADDETRSMVVPPTPPGPAPAIDAAVLLAPTPLTGPTTPPASVSDPTVPSTPMKVTDPTASPAPAPTADTDPTASPAPAPVTDPATPPAPAADIDPATSLTATPETEAAARPTAPRETGPTAPPTAPRETGPTAPSTVAPDTDPAKPTAAPGTDPAAPAAPVDPAFLLAPVPVGDPTAPLAPGQAAQGPGSQPPPAPPRARPARRPVSARSRSGPPVGEPTGPRGSGPGVVHRGGRRRSRWWLFALAAVVLPVVAYVATVELFGGSGQPEVGAAPDAAGAAAGPPTTTRPPATARTTCRWSSPAVGTATRTAPLDAIRAHMGWSDLFVVDEMRTWRGSDGLRHWYVKAHQEGDPSRRGRWLVRQDQDGQRLVLATAPSDTEGYTARDWRVAGGQRAPTGVAGCLAGT